MEPHFIWLCIVVKESVNEQVLTPSRRDYELTNVENLKYALNLQEILSLKTELLFNLILSYLPLRYYSVTDSDQMESFLFFFF